MQSRLNADRIIANWERRLLSPSELAEFPCDCCGLPINVRYEIHGRNYCEDCARSMHEAWLDDEPVECCMCEDELTDKYFDVDGDAYCENCFEAHFKN